MESTKVVIPARLSYANVWEPRANEPGDKPKYSVSLIIPKSDTKTIARIEKAIDAAIAAGATKLGKTKKTMLRLPLRDGDADRDDEAYADSVFVNASSISRPQIVDGNVDPILDQEEVYSGCYANVSVNFYAYNHPRGGKGVAAGLGNIQKVKDGDHLGGSRVDAASEFEALTSEEDDLL